MPLEKWDQETAMDTWGLIIATWKNGSLEKIVWKAKGEKLQPQ
jgi:hypothetical protein